MNIVFLQLYKEKEVDLTVVFVKGIQEMFQCFNNNFIMPPNFIGRTN